MFGTISFIGGYFIKNGIDLVTSTYNYVESKSQLSEKRKKTIEERRAQLKIDQNDSPILKIVIEEMLAYRPTAFTLDDRYLQLEQVLDAIEKAKSTKDSQEVVKLCKKLAEELAVNPSAIGFKNVFLERLLCINTRLAAMLTLLPRAKL